MRIFQVPILDMTFCLPPEAYEPPPPPFRESFNEENMANDKRGHRMADVKCR